MEFNINTIDILKINDQELSELLAQVFVEGGFTEPEVVVSHFEPSAVRKRGEMIVAREMNSSTLAGIVIIVPPGSPARRLAQDGETEMHLLAVKPDYRRHGLGRLLVEASIDKAKQGGYSKMILWTQTTMQAAHRLYESTGFVRTKEKDFSRNGRDFWVYEKALIQ